jgi:hypothetical protein
MSCSHVWCDKFGVFFFSLRAGFGFWVGERLDFISGARFYTGRQRKPREYLGVCQFNLFKGRILGHFSKRFRFRELHEFGEFVVDNGRTYMHTIGFLDFKINSIQLNCINSCQLLWIVLSP